VPSTTSSKGYVQARTRTLGDPTLAYDSQTCRQCPGRARPQAIRKLDQKLYGTDIDSASPPGPLLRRFRALGEVHPIVFGAYGEVSEGMEDGGPHRYKLADAWAPQIADQYLLDNVLAAEGIARSILREEIGAACFNAHAAAHPPWAHEVLPARLRRGVQAALRQRRAIQSSSSAGTRGTGHREAPGIW
jgi:hypothetical protein